VVRIHAHRRIPLPTPTICGFNCSLLLKASSWRDLVAGGNGVSLGWDPSWQGMKLVDTKSVECELGWADHHYSHCGSYQGLNSPSSILSSLLWLLLVLDGI
jgi:hypothetical protein